MFSTHQSLFLFYQRTSLVDISILYPVSALAQTSKWHVNIPSEPQVEARNLFTFSFLDPAWGSFFPGSLSRKILPGSEFSLSSFFFFFFFILSLPSGLWKLPICLWRSWSHSGFKQIFAKHLQDLGTNRWRHPSCFLNRNELDTQFSLNQETFVENLLCARYSFRVGESGSIRMLWAVRKGSLSRS